jgi:hypothetical protein
MLPTLGGLVSCGHLLEAGGQFRAPPRSPLGTPDLGPGQTSPTYVEMVA